AFCKTTGYRNEIWHKIANKNDYKVIVEILLESSDYTFVRQKEIEFISLYGRLCDGTGCLANISIGGESGSSGVKCSEERRRKIGLANSTKPKRYGEDNPFYGK